MKANRKALVVAAAMALAAPLEGTRRLAYYDPVGILTVCEGHTGSDIVKGKLYSVEECKEFFTADMTKAVDHVDRCAPGLPDGPRIAFSDAVFNLGPKVICDTTKSTLARKLKAGDVEGACNQLPRWDKATKFGVLITLPGLTKRRALEREICLQGPLETAAAAN